MTDWPTLDDKLGDWPWTISCLNGSAVWWHGRPARPGPGLPDGCPAETRAGRTVSVVILDVDGTERVATVGDRDIRPAGEIEAGPPIGGRGWSRKVDPHPWRLPHFEGPLRPRRPPKASKWAPAVHILADALPDDPFAVALARLAAFVNACEAIEAGQVIGQVDLFGGAA